MKKRAVNDTNPPASSAGQSRSAVASALFGTGMGSPDGKISRADERFTTSEAAGATGGSGSSWTLPFTRVAPSAYTAPRARSLRALVVPFGSPEEVKARLSEHDLHTFDVLAVRLTGGQNLSAAVAVAAEAAGECDPMVIVDADLPAPKRRDVDASWLRRFAVSVVPAEGANFAQYTLVDA